MMKLTVTLLGLWSACACAADAAPENSRLEIKDVVAGPNLGAILTALPKLARHNLDYRKYRISVCTEGDRLSVIFVDLDMSFGRPGVPTMPGVDIDLSPDGKTVTRFRYQK
jgi:hypothetical protein